MKIAAGVVGGILVVALAVVAGRHTVGSAKKKAEATVTTASSAPAGLVEFRDGKAGWAVSYPKAWTRLQSQNPDVVLVVSEKAPEANSGGSILARDITLAGPVTDANLPAAQDVAVALTLERIRDTEIEIWMGRKDLQIGDGVLRMG